MQEQAPKQVPLQLRREDIKVEKDCTHLVSDSVIDDEYKTILEVVMNTTAVTSSETLRSLECNIIQLQRSLDACKAFLSDDKDMMPFLKGRWLALEALRKYISRKHLELLAKEDGKKEKKTFAVQVKERLATLLPHDHHLFDELVGGLISEGWKQNGGSPVFRILSKQGTAIKIFRHAESPQVIKICFSAEPEGEDEKET